MKFCLLEYRVSNRTVRIHCIVELCSGEKYWRIADLGGENLDLRVRILSW